MHISKIISFTAQHPFKILNRIWCSVSLPFLATLFTLFAVLWLPAFPATFQPPLGIINSCRFYRFLSLCVYCDCDANVVAGKYDMSSIISCAMQKLLSNTDTKKVFVFSCFHLPVCRCHRRSIEMPQPNSMYCLAYAGIQTRIKHIHSHKYTHTPTHKLISPYRIIIYGNLYNKRFDFFRWAMACILLKCDCCVFNVCLCVCRQIVQLTTIADCLFVYIIIKNSCIFFCLHGSILLLYTPTQTHKHTKTVPLKW